jgi:transcriptional regulator with XRE-family HTH domain
MTITSAQVKEARELLGWTRTRLAIEAQVSEASVGRFERGTAHLGEWIRPTIRKALEQAGVEFIAENGGGARVRLRKGK